MKHLHRTISLLLITLLLGVCTPLLPGAGEASSSQRATGNETQIRRETVLLAQTKSSSPAECADSTISLHTTQTELPPFYLIEQSHSFACLNGRYAALSYRRAPLLSGTHIRTTVLRL